MSSENPNISSSPPSPPPPPPVSPPSREGNLTRIDSRMRFSLLASDVDLIHHVVNYECRFPPRRIKRRHSTILSPLISKERKQPLRRNKSAGAVLSGYTHSTSDNLDDSFLTSIEEDYDGEDEEEWLFDETTEPLLTVGFKAGGLKGSPTAKGSEDSLPSRASGELIVPRLKTIFQSLYEDDTRFVVMFCGTIIGSVATYASFERLNVLDPGCGSIIALLQYAVAVLERLPSARTYIRQPIIPLKFHGAFVLLQFLSTWLANTCLEFDLPFAHYLVIKNTNLVFTMIVGAIVLKEFYPFSQIMSVVFLSAGIMLTVLSEHESKQSEEMNDSSDLSKKRMMIGFLLCILSTVSMALLGSTQEYVFHRFKTKDGKAATAEALFYTHAFGLPLFFASSSTTSHIFALLTEWKVSAPLIICNLFSSVICKYCILELVDIAGNLTTTMALTLSRFFGIILSVFVLSNREHPGALFWVGSLAVVGGSISYMITNPHN